MATHWFFEYAMLLVITYSCIDLVLDSGELAACVRAAEPSSCSSRSSFIQYSDSITTAIFVFDLIVNIIARGFWSSKDSHAYFASGWRALDAAVIAICVVSATFGSSRRSLRAATSLRALRLVVRLPNLKVGQDVFYPAWSTLHALYSP